MKKEAISGDLFISIAIHLIFFLLLARVKLTRPVRFIEVSLVAETVSLPKNFKNIQHYESQTSPRRWSPGVGEPLPEAKISPEKTYSFPDPKISFEESPQISQEMEEKVVFPQHEKIAPDFSKFSKTPLQIMGPVSGRKILRRFYPEYPRQAQLSGFEGIVEIKFWVAPEGYVKSTQILKTSGYEVLDSAAVDAIKKWLFAPLKEAEEQWGEVNVRFELK